VWIVAPAMLAEFWLSSFLLFERGLSDWPAATGFGLVLLIWAVTVFIIVPSTALCLLLVATRALSLPNNTRKTERGANLLLTLCGWVAAPFAV